MVIFGASGDLTFRKLIPALYDLAYDRMLPVGFSVTGFSHRVMDDFAFASHLRVGVSRFSRRPLDDAIWDSFASGIRYIRGDFESSKDFRKLGNFLGKLDAERGSMGNRLYYLATPPMFYQRIVEQLGAEGLYHRFDPGWQRIIIEKPFGRDFTSAEALNQAINSVVNENDVYRIDHYLGKETVRNILALRFGNHIFEPLWNRNYIDHVQITVAESIGIEQRGSYYDQAGALRDMVQNHMMQLLSLIAMEPPGSLAADAVRDEKVKVLHAVRPIRPDSLSHSVVRAQYEAGYIDGQPVPGYQEEPGVASGSTTETFLAMKLHIDNWRWADVPFYLRTGKRLARRDTQVAIQFRLAPHRLFDDPTATTDSEPNMLVLDIQPDDGVLLRFKVKAPGPDFNLRPVNMQFTYNSAFNVAISDAYERLLLDAMLGDRTLFIRRDEVEAAWNIVDGVLEGWHAGPATAIPTYEAGSWGPEIADLFIQRDLRSWRNP